MRYSNYIREIRVKHGWKFIETFLNISTNDNLNHLPQYTPN